MTHGDDVGREPDAADLPSDGDDCVRIRLGVGGIGIAFSGRRAFFERHVAPLMEAMYRRAASGAGHAPSEKQDDAFQPSAPQRFQQFAGQVGGNAATVQQRAMAFAFYLWNYERRDEFDAPTIESFFRTVHEEPPEDLEGLLEELSGSKRWLEPGAHPGGWRLTTKGVNYVKNRLLGAT